MQRAIQVDQFITERWLQEPAVDAVRVDADRPDALAAHHERRDKRLLRLALGAHVVSAGVQIVRAKRIPRTIWRIRNDVDVAAELPRTVASDHRDDDLALAPAAFHVREALWSLVERVRPVDDGAEGS